MMHRTRTTRGFLSLVLVLFACSCRREAPEAPPEVVRHSISNRSVVVTEKAIGIVNETSVVRADFNQDALEDLAVAEKDAEGREVIGIYLRKPGEDELNREFFRAGGIRMQGDYRVSALMSARRDGFSDLLAIFNWRDGRKEMVHFRASGEDFREVARELMSPPTPVEK